MIRRPFPTDVDGLAACHVRCWREAYAGLLSASFVNALRVEDRARMWERTLQRSGAEDLAVAVVDGEVVGFAGTRPPHDDLPVELRGLYLHADLHGSGLGQDLLDAVLPDGPAALWVAEDNPRARSFYARNHFQPDGARKVVPEWEDLRTVRLVR